MHLNKRIFFGNTSHAGDKMSPPDDDGGRDCLGYVAALTTDTTTRDQLAYACLLMREAQHHGGEGGGPCMHDTPYRGRRESRSSLTRRGAC